MQNEEKGVDTGKQARDNLKDIDNVGSSSKRKTEKKTFYRCPCTGKDGVDCDFRLSKDEIKWNNSAMAMNHLQLEHFEQAQNKTSIKWIKVTLFASM